MPAPSRAPSSCAPIGIFDSGLGGLSVLRHVRALLPREHLLYFADSGFAPYGGRPEPEIVARTLAIGDFLLDQGAKALVVACNTATAAAIAALRARHPGLPVVGVEPGLKPAAAMTRSGLVGVLATQRTVESERFILLREQVMAASGVRFHVQACPGLADQVEKGELGSPATARLLQRYLGPLLAEGADTVVLGCTHYPFLLPLIEDICRRSGAAPVQVVDTGVAVARQLARLLEAGDLLCRADSGSVLCHTTGSAASVATASQRLLGLEVQVRSIGTA